MEATGIVTSETLSQLLNKVESEQNLFFMILAVSAMVLLPIVMGFKSKHRQEETTREKHILDAFTQNAAVMSALKTAIDGLNGTIGKTEGNISRISERLDMMGDTLAATQTRMDSVSDKTDVLIADNKEVKNEIKDVYKQLVIKAEA